VDVNAGPTRTGKSPQVWWLPNVLCHLTQRPSTRKRRSDNLREGFTNHDCSVPQRGVRSMAYGGKANRVTLTVGPDVASPPRLECPARPVAAGRLQHVLDEVRADGSVERCEAILTGNLTAGTPSECLPSELTRFMVRARVRVVGSRPQIFLRRSLAIA
jgi:hypothetical protein